MARHYSRRGARCMLRSDRWSLPVNMRDMLQACVINTREYCELHVADVEILPLPRRVTSGTTGRARVRVSLPSPAFDSIYPSRVYIDPKGIHQCRVVGAVAVTARHI